MSPTALWLRLFDRPDEAFEKFKEFWRVAVPRLLAPTKGKTSLDQTFDERAVKRVLLDTLEAYICGGEGREEEVFKVRACSLATLVK